ncbi:MAG: hypothetical protein ACLSCU_07485 [Eubacterium sp.]
MQQNMLESSRGLCYNSKTNVIWTDGGYRSWIIKDRAGGKTFLEGIGENGREGLKDTPHRISV